jgi:hypothetical protein
MSRTTQRLVAGISAATLIVLMSVSAEAKSKQRKTDVRAAHAEQYPNWSVVTSAPRGRACNGTCGRYNLPPGGGVNYLDGAGAGYYGGG